MVQLGQMDLWEVQDQLVSWVPGDLQDHLVQPDNQDLWVHRDYLVKLGHLDHSEIQVHLDRVEQPATRE